jgi:hypothetical protein
MAVLVGCIPSKGTSIQHFFHLGFFHFAPSSSSPLERSGPPTHANPPTSKRAVLAITKMSIAFFGVMVAQVIDSIEKGSENLVIV